MNKLWLLHGVCSRLSGNQNIQCLFMKNTWRIFNKILNWQTVFFLSLYYTSILGKKCSLGSGRSTQELRLLFLFTLLSCASRFVCTLHQNRAQSRLLYLLNRTAFRFSASSLYLVWSQTPPRVTISTVL